MLLITACDIQETLAPENKITESNPAEMKPGEIYQGEIDEGQIIPAPVDISLQQGASSQPSRTPLNLSIDDIALEDQSDDNIFFNDSGHAEKNSILFDELSKKQPAGNLSLSGELLTDENEYETKDLLKSVDGIHINVQGSFN